MLDPMIEHQAIAPAWVVLPIAVVALLASLVHLSMLHDPEVISEMPLSRRRLRTAGGVLTLITIPLLAYSFGIVTPADPRAFTMAWSASMGLLGMIVLVAALDALNSVVVHRRDLARHREQRRQTMQELAASMKLDHATRTAANRHVSSDHDG